MITQYDLDQLDSGPRLFAIHALVTLTETGFWDQVMKSNLERLTVGSRDEDPEVLAKQILAYREFKSTVDSLKYLGQHNKEQIDEQE